MELWWEDRVRMTRSETNAQTKNKAVLQLILMLGKSRSRLKKN